MFPIFWTFLTSFEKIKTSSKTGQFCKVIFVVKNYYVDLHIRKCLSFIPNVSDIFPVSYGQIKIKKITEKFTTENFLCFDVQRTCPKNSEENSKCFFDAPKFFFLKNNKFLKSDTELVNGFKYTIHGSLES